ncbi:MAG: hypothetical protein Q8K99_10675 [Actinomycetota bacterium]|nr:hypothetical protein [Actinomycetota bacterium]
MSGRSASRGWLALVLAIVLLLALTLAAGCARGDSGGVDEPGGVPTEEQGQEQGQAGDAIVGSNTDQIPPGREIAEGGGGPLSYTFREEWRRALAEAESWTAGAYLISASGDMINNEGVPSYWSMNFLNPDASAVLIVTIDPWGEVTETREVTGDSLKSFVTEYTKPIPYDVIDSDEVVVKGSLTLGAEYDLVKTKDPRVGLNFSVLDGSGPYWQYTLFYTSSAEYVSAQMNALTGEAKILDKP